MSEKPRLQTLGTGKLLLARLALIWERTGPAFWPAAAVIGLFMALALSDLLPYLPGWLHLVVLIGFGLGFLALLVRGVQLYRAPTTQDTHRWLEQVNALPHRPLETLEDVPAPTAGGETGLWRLHQARAAALVKRLKIGAPNPDMPRHDPYALRQAVVLVLLVTLVGANIQAPARLANAFSPDFSVISAGDLRTVDAWVTPPAYTGRAPVFLTGEESATAQATDGVLRIPVNSELTVQVAGFEQAPALNVAGASAEFATMGETGHRTVVVLEENGTVQITDGGKAIEEWSFDLIPDMPPVIAPVGDIGESRQGALQIAYIATDDYGLDHASVILRRTDMGARATQMLDPLELGLPLMGLNPKLSEGTGFFDLTPHLWAGLPVELSLVAVDMAGQRTESEPVQVVLPERIFTHPVARAIVEQRKRLVQDPNANRGAVSRALRGLAWKQEAYNEDVVVFMALTLSSRRLLAAVEPDSDADILELLWETALRIEEGRMALAARALRQAEEALMEALARDAETEELERLLNQLEAAMEEYLSAMMEDAQQFQQQNPEMAQPNPDMTMIDRQDLQSIMDRIREMLRSGMKDAARRMLSQLQQMMENLRAGQQMRMSPEGMEAMEMLNGLQELIQAQRELLDRTFQEMQRRQEMQQGQGMPQHGMPQQGMPQPGQGGENASGAMPPDAVLQEALRKQLGELMRRFGEMMGDIPRPFGRAEGAMRNSTDALNRDAPGQAVGPQGEALDQLQQAAQQMMEQFAQGQMPGRQIGMGQQGQEDPFGRMQGNEGDGVNQNDVNVPDEGALQRARTIRNELRRRSGQQERPMMELEYIERLLKQFQ